MRITVVPLILFLFFFNARAQTTSGLNDLVDSFASSEILQNAGWGVYAKYVDSGEEIITHNENLSLAPASGLKLFTTSAALYYLGSEHTFFTRLYYDGQLLDDGTLNGNIYIVGGGDPTLGSDQVKGSLALDKLIEQWITAVKNSGITSINGTIAADALLYEGLPIPDNWHWIDIGNYYGASSTALTINDNLYYLYFKPGKKTGETAEVLRTDPFVPGLTFTNYMLTGPKGSGDNGYIYCAPLQFNALLRGTVPAGYKEFSIKGSLPDPPLFAAQYLRSKLIDAGIPVLKNAVKLFEPVEYNEGSLISVIASPPIKDIIYVTNKRSNNLYTEMLLKAVALKQENYGSTSEGVVVLKKYLRELGVSTDGFHLSDGSGLSRSNAITAKMMVDLLAAVKQQPFFDDFYHSLAVAGDPNDLGFFKRYGKNTPVEKNARIKSGTIGGVRSHSGYIHDSNDRLIAFSFIANYYSGSMSKINAMHLQLLIALASL